MAITVGFLSYAWFEDPDKLEFRWGLLITVVLFLLIGAPLFNLVSLWQTNKQTSNFTLTLSIKLL